MKTQLTFGFLFVTESFANFLVLLLLPYFITKNENTINYHFFSVRFIKFKKIQEDSRRFKKIQEDSRRFKKIQEDSRRFKKIQEELNI